MKVKCRYAECPYDNVIDTDKDGYFLTGNSRFKTFYHNECARKQSSILVPLKLNQIKKLHSIVKEYYETHSYLDPRDDLETCMVLSSYIND